MSDTEKAVPCPISHPDWLDDKQIDEVCFCREFLAAHPMVCVKGSFFTVDGRISDETALAKQIYDTLRPWVCVGLSKKTDNLLSVLRAEAYATELPIQTDRIHVANGTLFLDGSFTEKKEFCRNRLSVEYRPEAAVPTRWLCFLEELLVSEDISTLQEFMGYCLIPTNKAQKMLMLIGQGGEGKSRIGVVMRAIFGESLVNGNLSKVETNRFARADLEHMLVMVDDDMKMEGLPETNYLKTIITAELPLDLEKKCKQSYQGSLYVRFLGFGNGSIKALYDRSQGFFRRQIILTTRKKAPDRVDDPALSEKLTAEKEGIFLWCFRGLQRLIQQNFKFSVSRQAEENIACAISDGNNIVDFMRSEGYFEFHADAEVSSRHFYTVYESWCVDNAHKPYSLHSFCQYLREHQDEYNLEATNNIHLSGGQRVRGYMGIQLLQPVFD